jgi:hypothetical protein
MPQAFYWVQASGAKGSNHTTDQCHSREDQRGSSDSAISIGDDLKTE